MPLLKVIRTSFFAALLMLTYGPLQAQRSLRNDDLKGIVEQIDAMRTGWMQMFEDASSKGDFGTLVPLRETFEGYMDRQAGAIRDVLVTGDDRPLLTATLNYIQINKGFAKSVMKKAETLKKENEEGIAGINRSITEFGDKERMFAIEVNNAIASSKEEEPEEQIAPEEKPEEDPNTEAEEESPKKSAKEKKTKAKKGEEGSQRRKLPHEIED